MTEKERKKIIEFIKANDSTYNYNAVNFKYYNNTDLLILKRRLDKDLEDKPDPKKKSGEIRPSRKN